MNPRKILTLLCVGAVSLHVARAQSPQNPILISSAPYTITQSGYHRLTTNLNYDPGSNNAANIITVNASNVTIDFNGFYIAGPVGNAAQQVTGIFANERSNITITNGTIAYCYQGILIIGNGLSTTNNVGHRIEKMRIPRCYYKGIDVENALTAEIIDNQVNFAGGTTIFGANSDGFGIYTNNGSPTITNNKVSTITALGTGTSWGIFCLNTSRTFVFGNRIDTATTGLRMQATLGKYQNNLTANITTTPFTGGNDAGGND